MIRRLILLFIFSLLPSVSRAEGWVVRLGNSGGKIGTGFLLAAEPGRAILVTADHVLAAAASEPLRLDNDLVAPQVVLGRDAQHDLAALLVPWAGESGALAASPPTIGQAVRIQGSTTGVQAGTITRIEDFRAWLDTTTVIPGDSGGPIVGADGRVVALIALGAVAHHPGGRSQYCPPTGGPMSDTIQVCLARWGWSCKNGTCQRITPPPTASVPSPSLPPFSPPTWVPLPDVPAIVETPALDRLLARLADAEQANHVLGARLESLENSLNKIPPPFDPDELNKKLASLEFELNKLPPSFDLSSLPPIKFSIRGPQGIESKNVHLGQEVRLFLEGTENHVSRPQ